MSVFTPVTTQELQAFLSQYAVGELQDFVGIEAGVENSNFFVNTSTGHYVLTLFEQHSPNELSYFLAVMRHMAGANLPIAAPIPTQTGALLSECKGKPAALITRLAGETLLQANLQQCAAMGELLAKIHLAGQSFRLKRAPDRGHIWRMQTAERLLPLVESEDRVLLSTSLQRQQTLQLADLPQGLIHADLFRDNTLFIHNQLSGVLDWYYACHDCWLYDLAIVVNDWCCLEAGALDPERLVSCLSAYQQIRPFTQLEAKQWQVLLEAAALRFWLSRLVAILEPRAGSLVLQKDPLEFRHKLEQRQTEAALIRACWQAAV
ncbi:homoserine kinase [uncultured Thiothrix sp.]|uniref:homoserine kinase n=1 Tax=uncultured Thiothrix sp. TaxID=223185 RepID=UPI002637454F|nr:homoserine kinase [uncultured Thiothrix sp.]